jgi:hypothetical protein
MIPKNLFDIYPEYTKVHGPYNSGKDKRARVILRNSEAGLKTCKLLARIIIECNISRQLTSQETVDHIDGNPLNDSLDNLQILSLSENARKSALGNKHSLGIKQTEAHKRSGSKNGKAKLSDLDILEIRKDFRINPVIDFFVNKYNLSRRTIENIITGRSYQKSGGNIYVLTPGRPSNNGRVAKLAEPQGI